MIGTIGWLIVAGSGLAVFGWMGLFIAVPALGFAGACYSHRNDEDYLG